MRVASPLEQLATAVLVGALSAKKMPDTGDYFKADWLKPYDKAPARETLTVYGASDYAATDDGGDYTVHDVVGMDPGSHLYVLDLWREQTSPEKWIEAFCDLVLRWRLLDWAEEQGQIKASIRPFLSRRQHERKPTSTASRFRPAATRQCGRNRSAAAWRWEGYMSRSMRRGIRRFARNC
jgi:hypothetical protein